MATKHRLFFVTALYILGGFCVVHAATLGVVVNNDAVDIGQAIRVDVPLDMQGDDANAIQGEILFPADQFVLKNVSDGSSPVSFWIDPPAETASGVISFSGIIPNGFQGSASSVISIWLSPTASGTVVISLGNVELLRNDGEGTPIVTATDTATVFVSGTVASSSPARPTSFITPESFTPVVSQDPNIFGDQYFLAFSTTDKGSGIDHYEVLEVPVPGSKIAVPQTWQVATSPYLLLDQTLESAIYVRAVDHDGNFIVVEIPAEHAGSARPNLWGILGTLILACLIPAIAWFVVIRRRNRRR